MIFIIYLLIYRLVRSVACKTDMAPAERPRGKPSVQVDEELEDASGSYHDDKYMFYVKSVYFNFVLKVMLTLFPGLCPPCARLIMSTFMTGN